MSKKLVVFGLLLISLVLSACGKQIKENVSYSKSNNTEKNLKATGDSLKRKDNLKKTNRCLFIRG